MAQNANNIEVGAGRIWIGGVVPTTGTPPSLSVHTSGVPSTPQTGFTEVGHTFGDSVFSTGGTYQDIESEQAFGIVDTYVDSQMCELTFVAQERVYLLLKTLFDGVGTVTDGSKHLFYGGGPFTVASQVVMLTAQQRKAPTKWETLTIYKAQSVSGIKLTYSRKNVGRYEVKMRGVHDTSRSVGDQLYQFVREL